MAGGGPSPPAGMSGCVSGTCQSMCQRMCHCPSGVHAHDGAQQLAALDCMVPALLPLPPGCHLLHDPALLHQGKCGFERVSDVTSVAFKLIGGQRQPSRHCRHSKTPQLWISGPPLPGLSREERGFSVPHSVHPLRPSLPVSFVPRMFVTFPGFVSTFLAVYPVHADHWDGTWCR